jgi:hypothetical protein
MKYFLLLALLIVGLVAAQSVIIQKPMKCADTKTVIQALTGEDYKEKPIWLGIESGATVSRYSLFVNEQTKTWTLIQFDENVACVLGVGEASTEIFNGPNI